MMAAVARQQRRAQLEAARGAVEAQRREQQAAAPAAAAAAAEQGQLMAEDLARLEAAFAEADQSEDDEEEDEAAAAAGPAVRSPVAGIQIVLGDRPASETLKAMWAALTPWRRLQFCWEILRGLFEPVSWPLRWSSCLGSALVFKEKRVDATPPPPPPTPKLDEDFIEAMKDDDLLTALFKEMRDTFPELMGPLLYDRWGVGGGGFGRALESEARDAEAPRSSYAAIALASRPLPSQNMK
jgi:hypothetical protein